MSVTNQPKPASRGRGSSGSSTRLPSTRERRPALAALAVLLIAGGGVLAGWLALRASATTSYWVVAQDIHPGEQITRDDLRADDFPSNSGFVPTTDTSPIGQYATRDLVADTPLVTNTFGAQPQIPQGAAVVPLNLSPGQVPYDIASGDYVQVVVAPSESDSHQPESLANGKVMGASPTVDGTIELKVAVSARCAGSIGVAAMNEEVSVSQVPRFTRPTCSTDDEQVLPQQPAPAN